MGDRQSKQLQQRLEGKSKFGKLVKIRCSFYDRSVRGEERSVVIAGVRFRRALSTKLSLAFIMREMGRYGGFWIEK